MLRYSQYPVHSPEQASEVRTRLMHHKDRQVQAKRPYKEAFTAFKAGILRCFLCLVGVVLKPETLFFLFTVKEFKERRLSTQYMLAEIRQMR